MPLPAPATARRITPTNTLQAKVPPYGGPSLDEMQADVDAALEDLRADGKEWLRQSVGRLTVLLTEAAAGEAGPPVEAISRIMHDLRAVAIQFDYPLLARAAQSLCDFIVADPALAAARLDVIQVHIDAIVVILADDLRGAGTAQAVRVVEGLGRAVDKARAIAAGPDDA